MAPRLAGIDDDALLTWLEPEGKGHRLRAARLDVERNVWGEPRTIAAGGVFFANWADVPGAVQDGQGRLVAHWLEKLGEDTYAYGVRIARSGDGGETWEIGGLLHDDASPTEHGFVSYVALQEGIRAFWLDGREMDRGGGMQLRTARLENGTPRESVVLDERVCECCATDAAMTSSGPIVVYRDRSADEIRDVGYVVGRGSGFAAPALVHSDGWRIPGCPVNGPAVDAAGEDVFVAWFTAAGERPRVHAAFSRDAGASFGPPIPLDEERPVGRVDLALDGTGGAVVAWIATAAGGPEIRLQRVAPDGLRGRPRAVSSTTVRRSAGVPTLLRRGGRIVVVWVEDGSPTRLHAASIAIDEL